MADKHTKRELFETLVVFASAAEADAWIIDGLNHELDLLAKRANGAKGKTKTQIANDSVKHDIVNAIAGGHTRAGEIAEVCGVSVQKVSALLRQMVDVGSVKRETDKKVTTFSLV